MSQSETIIPPPPDGIPPSSPAGEGSVETDGDPRPPLTEEEAVASTLRSPPTYPADADS
jgi:hypothetical protein